MASLVETLIDVLNQEDAQYQKLIELSSQKTMVIVRADLEGLQRITDDEQLIVEEINSLEKTRTQTMNEIAKSPHFITRQISEGTKSFVAGSRQAA